MHGKSIIAAMPYRIASIVIGSMCISPSFANLYPPDQKITNMNGAAIQKYLFRILSLYTVAFLAEIYMELVM